jgi:hypothetical protein
MATASYKNNVEKLEKFDFKNTHICEYQKGKPVTVESTGVVIAKGPCSYVGLLSDGTVLKTGIAGESVLARWKKTFGVMTPKSSHRKNEIDDGIRLKKIWIGQSLEIWAKPALMIEIPYAGSAVNFPAHHAEELFLDDQFEPKFGKPLAARKERLKKIGASKV